MIRLIILFYIFSIKFFYSDSIIINFELLGAIPNEESYEIALYNGNLFNKTINNLQNGDIFVIPGPKNKTFSLTGGLITENLTNIKWILNGNIKFNDNRDKWPKQNNGKLMNCIYLINLNNFTISSDNKDKGTLDGNGKRWWGSIKYLEYQGDRPRLLHIKNSKNVLIEKVSYLFIKYLITSI